MGVVLAHDLPDHPRALHIRPIGDDVGLVHREKDPAVDRLQSIANIRQRATHDHAHGVIEVGMPHFGFQAYREGLFGKLLHRGGDFREWVVKT